MAKPTRTHEIIGMIRNGNAGLAIREPRATNPYVTNDPNETASIEEKYGTLANTEDRTMVNHNQPLATNGEETQNVKSAIKTVELLCRPTRCINTNDPRPPKRIEHRAANPRMLIWGPGFIVHSPNVEFIHADDGASPAVQGT